MPKAAKVLVPGPEPSEELAYSSTAARIKAPDETLQARGLLCELEGETTFFGLSFSSESGI